MYFLLKTLTILQEASLLLILAELSIQINLIQNFKRIGVVVAVANVIMIFLIMILEHSEFIASESYLWFVVAGLEMVLALITIIMTIKLFS